MANAHEQLLQQTRLSYQGSARIDLDRFDYQTVRGTLLNEQNIRRLVTIFETEGCIRRGDPEHNVSVTISRAHLTEAVRVSGITSADLYNIEPPTLDLQHGLQLPILHGKHRIIAAKRHLDNRGGRWWIADLYLDDLSPAGREILREKCANSRPICDGDIFRYLRHYENQNDTAQAGKWRARLSQSKLKDITTLYKIPEMLQAFDNLLPFRGLWSALEIGCFHRILALHCPQESIRYLNTILVVWRTVLLNQQSLYQCLDPATVQHLEALCPMISTSDAERLRIMMSEGTLFPSIVETTTRASILDALLATRWPFLTLFTYLEDTKILELGMKPLRTLLPPANDVQSKKMALPDRFDRVFHYTEDCVSLQMSNGRYEIRGCDRDTSTRLSFSQLFLCSLRQSESLTGIEPRLDDRMATPKKRMHNISHARKVLAETAYTLGYRTEAIDAYRTGDPDVEFTMEFLATLRPYEDFEMSESIRASLADSICHRIRHATALSLNSNDRPLYTTDIGDISKDYRCGRPHAKERRERKYMYVEFMYGSYRPSRRAYPTTIAMRRYTFLAFFGEFDLHNLSRSSIRGPENRVSVQVSEDQGADIIRDTAGANAFSEQDDIVQGPRDSLLTVETVQEIMSPDSSVYSQRHSSTQQIVTIVRGYGQFHSFTGSIEELAEAFRRQVSNGILVYLDHDSVYTIYSNNQDERVDFISYLENLANNGCYFMTVADDDTILLISLTDLVRAMETVRIIVVRTQTREAEPETSS